MATNPFDVFDAKAPAAGNAFDRFDRAAAPSGGLTPESPREGGLLSTIGNVLKTADQVSSRGINRIAGGLGRMGESVADAVGAGGVGDWLGNQATLNERNAAVPVAGQTTFDDVKANPSAGNIAKFGVETGLGATPDLAAAVVALPAYAASIEGSTAHARAANDGRDHATLTDYAAAVPNTAANVVLQKFGVGGKGLLSTLAREVGAQAGIAGGDYATTNLGTKAGFSLPELGSRMVEGAATGLALTGPVHGARVLRNMWAGRGVDTSGVGDDAMVAASLDGSIDPNVHPDEVIATLRGAGVDPASFADPAAAAARVERARARKPNVFDAFDAADGDGPAPPPAPMPERVLPDDVVLHANPEGLVRSDDLGAQTGLARHRAAGENVTETAQGHVGRDPVLGEILDSNLPHDAKIGALLDRLKKFRDEADAYQAPEHHLPPEVDPRAVVTPFHEPTADAARSHRLDPRSRGVPQDVVAYFRGKGLSEGQARGIAAGVQAESAGDHNARNPTSGAMGLGQWLGPRRDTLIARYGENPTRTQQLDFLHHELMGGDAGGKHVLAQSDEGAVLNAYIRKFMRPGAGAETDGDIARGRAALGEQPNETVYRGPAPRDDPFHSESGFERQDAPTSPTDAERAAGPTEGMTATGDSSRPFRSSTDDPAGEPGYWEARAQMKADELHAEWEASKKSQGTSSGDPSEKYGANGYDQRPHKPGEHWAMTDDGMIAGAKGKPVAFRNSKEAAKFAAKEGLGGDFERETWMANSERVVLRRRAGSTYGESTAARGPVEPPAGRSADTGQRMVEAPPRPSDVTPDKASPSVVDHGYVSDQQAHLDAAPPVEPGQHREGGTFERDRPAPLGPEPKPARTFLHAVRDHLGDLTQQAGQRVRISAQEAIDHGFAADDLFIDPRAKYPQVKAHLARIFASTKAPLMSRGQPTKIISPDALTDVFDGSDWGHDGRGYDTHGGRLDPAEVVDLMHRAATGDESATDRSDPAHDTRQEWLAHEDDVNRFAARYGDDWHNMPDEELDRVDAEHGDDIQRLADDVFLADKAPEVPAGDPRFHEGQANEPHPANPDRPETESGGGAGRREPAGSPGESSEGEAHPAADERQAGAHANEDPLAPRAQDTKDYLARRAAEPLKPRVEQKAPGSDGGLHDTRDTTDDMFGGEAKKPRRGFRDLLKDDKGSFNPDVIPALAGKILDLDALKDDFGAIHGVVSKPVKTTIAALKGLDRFASAVAYSADGALRTLARHYGSPTLVKLADMFQARAGADDATGRTYDEALKRAHGMYRSRLDEAVKPFIGNAAAMGRIRDLLATPDKVIRATENERKAARALRDMLNDVLAYRRAAGEDIGEAKAYFPRVLDAIAVAKNPAEFKKAAEGLYRRLGVDDPEASAAAWYTRILDTHSGIDGGEEYVRAGGKPSSAKAREFGKEADTVLKDFYQKDPLLVLSDYVTGSVKRAEQTRRFGAKGPVNSPERTAWMKEHGTKSQWDVMLDDLRSELRASGEDASGVVERAAAIKDSNLGRLTPFGAKASRTISAIHAWNQLSTLQRVTLSSVGDLAMGFVRGGPRMGVTHLATSLAETARNIAHADSSDARRWAEAIGVVGSGTATSLLQARADAEGGAIGHAKLLGSFYRKVGIEQLTDGGRTAATNNGRVMLDTLAHDLESPKPRTRSRAAFYLRELGVSDPSGFGEWLRKNQPTLDDLKTDTGHAADYATALVRFADQSVLMPTKAQKPQWAAHPLGSLVFALQSYTAAFTQNVLKRVGRLGSKAVTERDPAYLIPAAGTVMLAGATMLQDYLRRTLFGSTVSQDNETTFDYALRIADRMGATGLFSPFLNAMQGLRYHRSMSSSLQGAVIGRAADGIDAGAGLFIGNNPKTNAAERKAAGLLYDMAIDPAINAFGAGRVKGAAGSALILGTGNRRGGVLPSDRDAFVDGVAGTKKE